MPIAQYVRPQLSKQHPHFDPEFETYTYGDPTPLKRRQLLELRPGDLLLFYSGLQPDPLIDRARLYFIGYFEVEHVHDLRDSTAHDMESLRTKIGKNAHFFRTSPDRGLVVIQGRNTQSRLLQKAVPVGDGGGNILPDLGRQIGYNGSLRRAIGHWVTEQDKIAVLHRWLTDGPASLVGPNTTLYTYIVANDCGFAPNPESGYCSLACCKPVIRRCASEGCWIIGFCPSREGPGKVTYVMRVNATMSFKDYSRNRRFEDRIDNIYRPSSEGRYEFVPNRDLNYHNTPSENHHDTQTDRVLIGSIFWYFGEKAVELPNDILDAIGKQGRWTRKITEAKSIRTLVCWLTDHYRIGVHGKPHDASSETPSKFKTRCRPC